MVMEFDKIKFSSKDFIQLLGIAAMLMTTYYNLVSEIRQNKVFDEADKRIIDYRLRALERSNKPINYKSDEQPSAVMPEEIRSPRWKGVSLGSN